MRKEKLLELLSRSAYDAIVLTSEVNRRYATGFHSTAGAVYLSEAHAVFFTDFRYLEAARAAIKEFEVREIKAGQTYEELAGALAKEDNIQCMALEDETLTYSDYTEWTDELDVDMIQGLGTIYPSCAP